jgi:ribose transport system substrate-binding protein
VNNVAEMIRAKTDVAVQYRLDSADAPIIGDLFHTAQIPWISVDALHPGAVYLGVDNYKCGYAAGVALGAFAKEHWKGRVEKIVFLESAERGAVAQSRSAGFSKAIEAELKQEFLRLPGGDDKTLARLSLSSYLKKQSALKRLLLSSHGENGALGAIDALHEFELDSAVVGMDGGVDAVRFLAGNNAPYIAFIVLSVERYGAAVADLVLRLMNNEQVAPFCYVEYELVDQAKARAMVATSDLRSRRSRYVL